MVGVYSRAFARGTLGTYIHTNNLQESTNNQVICTQQLRVLVWNFYLSFTQNIKYLQKDLLVVDPSVHPPSFYAFCLPYSGRFVVDRRNTYTATMSLSSVDFGDPFRHWLCLFPIPSPANSIRCCCSCVVWVLDSTHIGVGIFRTGIFRWVAWRKQRQKHMIFRINHFIDEYFRRNIFIRLEDPL